MTGPAGLSSGARRQLLAAYRAAPVLAGATAAPLIDALRNAWPGTIAGLAEDELLTELLVSTPIYPMELERALTSVRRVALLDSRPDNASLAPFLARLARQGQLNEYAWAANPEEWRRVYELAGRIADLTAAEAMLLGAYVPLHRFEGAGALLERGWGPPFDAVLREQILGPAEDAAMGAEVEALTPIRSGASEVVRSRYEENPYPRWGRVTPRAPVDSIVGIRVPDAPRILIAGCGTGYQAIAVAQYFPHGHVTAVDLSRASLGYGLRMARQAGVENISFHQADLLELAGSGDRFDVIVCTGVLHHMADPFEGARAVAGLLKPGGLMKIGIYSALARAKLQPAKAVARRFASNQIVMARQAVAQGGPAEQQATHFLDFYASSPCRDLLMHVLEHEMTLDDLGRMLLENRLDLVEVTVPPYIATKFSAMFPAAALRQLGAWAEFEAAHPDTFENMYQVWTVKAG